MDEELILQNTQIQPDCQTLADTLGAIATHLTAPTVTIGEIRSLLSGQIYALLLLLLAIPNLVPFPVPGLSAVLGIPLFLLAIQRCIGLQVPWFPESVVRKTLQTAHIHSVFARIMPYLKKAEPWLSPRWQILLVPPMDRIISMVCALLSLVMILPIPFGNSLPALSISLFAIAILQRNGLFLLLGGFASVVASAVVLTSVGAVMVLLHTLF